MHCESSHKELEQKINKLELEIVKLKQVEMELQKTAQLTGTIKNTDAVFIVDIPERKIEYVNSAVELIFDYSPAESLGKPTSFFYPNNEGFLDFGKKLRYSLEQGDDFLHTEQVLKRKNGELFTSKITTIFLKKKDAVIKVISIIRDISEKKII